MLGTFLGPIGTKEPSWLRKEGSMAEPVSMIGYTRVSKADSRQISETDLRCRFSC